MKIYKVIMLLSAMLTITTLQADEGMWLPSLLNKVNVNTMSELGAELSADDIYNINSASLKDAVISLNGGSCTGELVSAEGLFLTNHHCGYGQIQKHSSEEQNILRDGFWAKNHAEELPNKGMFVSFLVRVEDVTAQVLAGVNNEMTEAERADSIRSVSSVLEDEAVKDTHYEARVKSFFSDNQYLLFVYETFRDVRLVGAPPHFIGKFGGDTDNWMWPRHTGDFSMFRIYAAPDGTPAEYSEENVPMKPRHFFPVSLKGYQENDFAMVMGYPGSTDRYLTSDGVEFTMNVINSTRINLRKAKLDIIREYMATSDKATIQYASKHARSSNYYKYSIGQNRGLERLGVVAEKEAVEKEFAAWVKQNDERMAKYGEALSLIENAYADQNDDKALNYIAEAFLRGPEIFMMARRFQTLEGMLKKDSSEDKIKEETEKLREQALEYFKDYDAETDRRIVAALTEIFVNDIETTYHPGFISEIHSKYKGDYSKWSEKLFAKSMIDDQAAMMSFLDNPKHKSIAKDPAYQAAIAIFDARSLALEDNKDEQTALTKGYRLFLGGLLEMNKDQQYYPNANSTMRLTYGSIYGYEPRDGVEYNYYTTLSGYVEKEIPGDREFDVWPRLKELYHAGEYGQYASPAGELHTCFISNNDITGGNSGSPVLNKNGELIGIAFDGNWEAMSGDIAFEPELQKCINVDIRYVLWVIDVFAKAGHLVDEMTLVK